MKKFLKYIVTLLLFAIIVLVLINITVINESDEYVYKDISKLPEKQAVIILGAFVRGDMLSNVLEDRVVMGLEIYNSHKCEKILLSGDHGKVDYDEVNGMRLYILSNYENVPEEDIFLDHAGFDTYDSLYRAKEIFEIENAVIVTQDFHINRAVYIARKLGIDAVGFSVNQEKYHKILQLRWRSREVLSRIKAFFDIKVHSKPKYLGEIIPIKGDGRKSWDEIE